MDEFLDLLSERLDLRWREGNGLPIMAKVAPVEAVPRVGSADIASIRDEVHASRSRHLSEEVFRAIAGRSLVGDSIEATRGHLSGCLVCLRAYAEFRSLLEASGSGLERR